MEQYIMKFIRYLQYRYLKNEYGQGYWNIH
jgi:hypothetical protein